jgi:hypothetical protein
LSLLDFITSNAGNFFISKDFKKYTNIIGIHIKAVLIKLIILLV